MELEFILGIQVLFLSGITMGYHSLNMDSSTIQKYLILVARFTTCFLIGQSFDIACTAIYTAVQTREVQVPKIKWQEKYRNTLYVLAASVSVLVYNWHSLLELEVILLLMAFAVARYLELKRRQATITYGEGMACSFAEGYLYQVIPSDGAKFFGLEEHIRAVEAGQRVIFPVRRLFIIITKSLFCPPNLEHYNKNDDSLPKLEACRVSEETKQSLPDVKRDVAGVCDRVYRNTAYKIRRHPRDPRPVHVVAECATPLHTLCKVLQRPTVYQHLALADGDEITAQFCATLPKIVASSPSLRGKCDLVYFDDTNPEENLAEVLLAKVREIEPNFENITRNE